MPWDVVVLSVWLNDPRCCPTPLVSGLDSGKVVGFVMDALRMQAHPTSAGLSGLCVDPHLSMEAAYVQV